MIRVIRVLFLFSASSAPLRLKKLKPRQGRSLSPEFQHQPRTQPEIMHRILIGESRQVICLQHAHRQGTIHPPINRRSNIKTEKRLAVFKNDIVYRESLSMVQDTGHKMCGDYRR